MLLIILLSNFYFDGQQVLFNYNAKISKHRMYDVMDTQDLRTETRFGLHSYSLLCVMRYYLYCFEKKKKKKKKRELTTNDEIVLG